MRRIYWLREDIAGIVLYHAHTSRKKRDQLVKTNKYYTKVYARQVPKWHYRYIDELLKF